MKQLLQTADQAVIVGLNDRAFFGLLEQEHVYELEPPVTPDAVQVSSSSKESPGNTSSSNPLEIQAVALIKDEESKSHSYYCAVSRYDKSLCIYHINVVSSPSSTAVQNNNNNQQSHHHHPLKKVAPLTVHKTAKRAGSLCFASVPPSNSRKNEKDLVVLIAGDLAGDAVAFSLRKRTTLSSSESSSSSGEKEDISSLDNINNRNRRLLLGHTASMLTGVQVVQDDDDDGSVGVVARILTSDRDEKIRISCFPDTFLIEGFLLGHEAFVSSIDVAKQKGVTRCVSCSGDGSVRLWNYAKSCELAVMQSNAQDSNNNNHDDDDDALVPSRVAINATGDTIAVIYDESRRLDILHWNDDENKKPSEFVVTRSLECPSAALSIDVLDGHESCLVLMAGPTYLGAYRLVISEDEESGMEAAAYYCDYSFCRALQSYAKKESITMPTSTLEKDKSGQFKMQKLNETRGPAQNMPWNDASRKEIARERNRRSNKRRHEKSGAEEEDTTYSKAS